MGSDLGRGRRKPRAVSGPAETCVPSPGEAALGRETRRVFPRGSLCKGPAVRKHEAPNERIGILGRGAWTEAGGRGGGSDTGGVLSSEARESRQGSAFLGSQWFRLRSRRHNYVLSSLTSRHPESFHMAFLPPLSFLGLCPSFPHSSDELSVYSHFRPHCMQLWQPVWPLMFGF